MLLTIHHESGYRCCRCGFAFTNCRGSWLSSFPSAVMTAFLIWKRLLTKLHAMRFQILHVWDFRVVLLTCSIRTCQNWLVIISMYKTALRLILKSLHCLEHVFAVHSQNELKSKLKEIRLSDGWSGAEISTVIRIGDWISHITKAISSSAQLSLIWFIWIDYVDQRCYKRQTIIAWIEQLWHLVDLKITKSVPLCEQNMYFRDCEKITLCVCTLRCIARLQFSQLVYANDIPILYQR